jgi:hypothetical protein
MIVELRCDAMRRAVEFCGAQRFDVMEILTGFVCPLREDRI